MPISSTEKTPFSKESEVEIASKIAMEIRRLADQTYSRERQTELNKRGKELGRVAGLKDAKELIDSIFGPGRDRKWMITSITAGTLESPSDVLKFSRSLEFADDYSACLSGISSLLACRPDITLDEFNKAAPLLKEEMRSIVNGAAIKSSSSNEQFKSQVDETVAFIEVNTEHADTEKLITEYFSTLASIAPLRALESWIDELNGMKSYNPESWERDKILSYALRQDPQSAINSINSRLSPENPIEKGKMLAAALEEWTRIDMNSAVDWVSKTNIPNDTIQSILITPLFDQALGAGDLSTAMMWMEEMRDPKVRERVQAKLSSQK